MEEQFDVVVIGAGAAGLFCAAEAARRGRRTLILERSTKPAEKIRISGGGRCNFTNLHCAPVNFLSGNAHFCVSALKRFDQHAFVRRLSERGVGFHEKTLGQLFCDVSSKAIIDMLMDGISAENVTLQTGVNPGAISRLDDGFEISTDLKTIRARSVVVATGGKSIPKMGATGYAYEVARSFGLAIIEPEPALVPVMFSEPLLAPIAELAGVSVDARVCCNGASFDEALLFTHRGLSGPAILQISSYWSPGQMLEIDLARGRDTVNELRNARSERPRLTLPIALAAILPKRLAAQIAQRTFQEARLADLSDKKLQMVASEIHHWRVTPSGTEGWRTAEVTRGGVDTDELSSKTMEARKAPGLYFIGECVDVTGWLGGYNFQWAWSSGWAAGQVV